MDKHCCEPITRVESGWRIDYNPCRHYNTLYITIDTKELLFNGVAYNRFNIQDINYQNGTIYINVGNKLLSCKIPNASRECSGLMSPLDKQQLDYVFQLLENGIDSINFSNIPSWGVWLDQNIDRQIQVFVDPVKTLDELENLPEGVEKLISAQLLKNLIEINNLKYNPDEEPVIQTYTVRLFINNNLIDTATVNSGANYSYTYNELPDGYELVGTGVTINKKNITKQNITGNTDINLSTQLIQYTITESGYNSSIWTRTGYPTNGKYTVENTPFTLTYTLNNSSQYATSGVTISGRTDLSVNKSGNTYTIQIPQGTIENITINLVASEVEIPVINLNPSSEQTITESLAITATVTNGNSNQVTWSLDNSGTTGETFRLNQNIGSSVTVYANDTTEPNGIPGTIDGIGTYGSSINGDPRIRASFRGSGRVDVKEYSTNVTASYPNAESKSIQVTFRKTKNPLSTGNYTWEVVSGQSLPNGITLQESSSSTDGFNDLLVFINTTDNDITVPAGTIQVSNENASNNPVVYNQDIVVPTKTQQAEKNAYLDDQSLRRTRGNDLDYVSWSNASVSPSPTTSGTYITLTKGTVSAFYNLNEASTTLHFENIQNPRVTYDGYSSYISISEIQNNQATVSVVDGTKIEGQVCRIKVFDGETLVTTLELRVNRDIKNQEVTTSATYSQWVNNENKGIISFVDGVKFRALDVENNNTRVTIKVSYGGETALQTVDYIVSPAPPAQEYYWYVGTDPITTASTPGSGTVTDDETQTGWHSISGTPTEIQVGPTARLSANANWYIAIPSTFGITKATSGGLTDESVSSSLMTLSDGVEYRVFITTLAKKVEYLMTK